jgi:hypothetical protein
MNQDQDRCASHGCTCLLAGKSMIVARDGKRYCRKHGDRLPKYLRRRPRLPKPLTESESTR